MTTVAPGTPNWVDLSSPDMEGTRRFYGELFGWTAHVATEAEAGGYTIFNKDGKPVAGAGPQFNEEQPPAWMTYVATDDADAVAVRVEKAGGKILMAPFDVMQHGRMGMFADPAGAVFGVWQPGTMRGAELFNQPGSLTWNELTTRDPQGAKEFYGAVFGWAAEDSAMGPVTYTVWQLDGKPVGGMMPMEGDQWPADLPPHWVVYFEVAGCDETVAKATELGGGVTAPPTDIPQGRFAGLSDPQGAAFSVIESARS
jgi:predicted enzyme related to lactoylglutathione lyase